MLTEAERELIKKNLLQVLESEEATPAERLEGSKLLLELDKAGGSYCNAYGVGDYTVPYLTLSGFLRAVTYHNIRKLETERESVGG